MTHKIIGFSAEAGQVAIRYSDSAPPIAVDLPINDEGLFPIGDELHSYLSGFIPFVDTRRKDALAAGVANAHAIEALVVHEEPVLPQETEPSPEAIEAAERFEQEEFDLRMRQSLVRLGYTSS